MINDNLLGLLRADSVTELVMVTYLRNCSVSRSASYDRMIEFVILIKLYITFTRKMNIVFLFKRRAYSMPLGWTKFGLHTI